MNRLVLGFSLFCTGPDLLAIVWRERVNRDLFNPMAKHIGLQEHAPACFLFHVISCIEEKLLSGIGLYAPV